MIFYQKKDCFGAAPKVRAGLALARETHALPGTQQQQFA